MKLEDGEYTTQGFLSYLNTEYGGKLNETPFTSNDVAQYLIRGYTPHKYGFLQLSSKTHDGVRIITALTKAELEKKLAAEKKSKKKK
jgi:hypothetical protein